MQDPEPASAARPLRPQSDRCSSRLLGSASGRCAERLVDRNEAIEIVPHGAIDEEIGTDVSSGCLRLETLSEFRIEANRLGDAFAELAGTASPLMLGAHDPI